MKIEVKPDLCTGCRLCRQICAIEHFDEINPNKAALRIEARFPEPGQYHPRVCVSCGKCQEACPTEAIVAEEKGGRRVKEGLCTNCGLCVSACPNGVVFQHPDLRRVIICDFCFACTEVCNTGALTKGKDI